MAVQASDVAAVLRRRLPGLGTVKLHKLLYYCQGHHLAAFGEPLFADTISAWDMGPVVGTLWKDEKEGRTAAGEPAGLGEAALNTIGYVVSRYGGLSGREVEQLTHGEAPWQQADRQRPPGGRATIRTEWIREHFRGCVAEPVLRAWLAGTRDRHPQAGTPDSREQVLARRAEIAAGGGSGGA